MWRRICEHQHQYRHVYVTPFEAEWLQAYDLWQPGYTLHRFSTSSQDLPEANQERLAWELGRLPESGSSTIGSLDHATFHATAGDGRRGPGWSGTLRQVPPRGSRRTPYLTAPVQGQQPRQDDVLLQRALRRRVPARVVFALWYRRLRI